MPTVPQNWLADDQDAGQRILPFLGDDPLQMTPLPLARNDGPFILSDLANQEPQPPRGTSLSLLMEPDEIASVPGLPDYAYGGNGGLGDYADQRVRQDVGGQQAQVAIVVRSARGGSRGWEGLSAALLPSLRTGI